MNKCHDLDQFYFLDDSKKTMIFITGKNSRHNYDGAITVSSLDGNPLVIKKFGNTKFGPVLGFDTMTGNLKISVRTAEYMEEGNSTIYPTLIVQTFYNGMPIQQNAFPITGNLLVKMEENIVGGKKLKRT